ncbi:potassium transporter-domain-containing protein [Gaertneriomyces semiglobifer]|nr:potassium transporter-domain-containing protein [Gaertneriomyces semiglobifer]
MSSGDWPISTALVDLEASVPQIQDNASASSKSTDSLSESESLLSSTPNRASSMTDNGGKSKEELDLEAGPTDATERKRGKANSDASTRSIKSLVGAVGASRTSLNNRSQGLLVPKGSSSSKSNIRWSQEVLNRDPVPADKAQDEAEKGVAQARPTENATEPKSDATKTTAPVVTNSAGAALVPAVSATPLGPGGAAPGFYPDMSATGTISKRPGAAASTILRSASEAQDGAAPTLNPFAAPTMRQRKKAAGGKDGGDKPAEKRRMSLGAALCIPPPPRMSHDMRLAQLLKLTFAAAGIVYGDIGVSPLYVMKTIFGHPIVTAGVDHDWHPVDKDGILGALSMLFWIITLVVGIKYNLFVLKADKNGEGGIWALIAQLPFDSDESDIWKHRTVIYVVGLLSAAFLVGDSLMSPAISVLSAFEGVQQYAGSASFGQWEVTGCAVAVICSIYFWQRFGTQFLQRVYAPLFASWFLVIGLVGAYNIHYFPGIFEAISPHRLFMYIGNNPFRAFSVLSNVVLAVAGCESMYADLGHFTARPIRLAFMSIVYPSIMLSFFGQGAYIYSHPEAANGPFFTSVPEPVKWPVLVIATLAAIMAAQGSISGTSSLIDQSISLGTFPNFATVHPTSAAEVYIPALNFIMFCGTVGLTLGFRHSDSIAAIAGINISGSMMMTSFLYMVVMHHAWKHHWTHTLAYGLLFLTIDLTLFSSSLRKVAHLGWVALLIAACFFVLMFIWYFTTNEVNQWSRDRLLLMSELRQNVKLISRTQGTVLFVSNTDEDVPNVLSICARRLNSLPANIICMSAVAQPAPFIAEEEKVVFRTVDAVAGIYRLVISYGYAERSMNVVAAVERAKKRGLRLQAGEEVAFVVGRDMIQTGPKSSWIARLRRTVFDVIARNTQGKIDYYSLPRDSTLEVSKVLHRPVGRSGCSAVGCNVDQFST